jgi:hypothetical protein
VWLVGGVSIRFFFIYKHLSLPFCVLFVKKFLSFFYADTPAAFYLGLVFCLAV